MKFLRKRQVEEIDRLFAEAARIVSSQQTVIDLLAEANTEMQTALVEQQRATLRIVQSIRFALDEDVDISETLRESERDLADALALVEEHLPTSP